jgi:hypothetical protein
MENNAQIDFIEEHINTVKKEILKNVKCGRIPDGWEGLELKQYISDCFHIPASWWKTGKRKREYDNDISVNCL